MRVLLQTYAFFPSWGGVQKFAHSLYTFLHNRRCNARIATANRIVISESEKYFAWPWSNKVGTKLNRFGFTAVSLARAHKKYDPRNILFSVYLILAYFRYWFYLVLFRPQIVHLIYINVDAVFAVRAKKMFKFKLLSSCRGSDLLAFDNQSSFVQQVVLKTLKESDAITAVSDELGARVKVLLGDENIPVHVIRNGIELNHSSGLKSQKAGAKYFVFAGHMDENKNPAVVIKAFSHFRKKHPECKLILIGSGPLLNPVSAMIARLGLDNSVEFPGALSPQESFRYIENAAALIIASASEGCPNVVLEAMSAQTPVIGSNKSGIKEIIRHEVNGLLFEWNNPAQLAECMERIIESEDLRMRLVESALNTLRENHDLNEIMENYLTLYEELSNSRCPT